MLLQNCADSSGHVASSSPIIVANHSLNRDIHFGWNKQHVLFVG